MTNLGKAAYAVLVIGGLNWGLIGFFDYNLVEKVFSDDMSRIIYGVVGIAALYGVYAIMNMQQRPAGKKGA